MALRPLHDRVVIRARGRSRDEEGWDHHPGYRQRKTAAWRSEGRGNGKLLENGERMPPDIKAGDRILFGKYSGAEIKIDGEEYLILKEDEILGVVES